MTPHPLFLVITLFFVLPPRPSLANDEKSDEARVHLERGKAFLSQNQYEKAAIHFENAYGLSADTEILYYIGLAEIETGNFARSLSAFERYLAEGGEDLPQDRQDNAKKQMAILHERVAKVEIDTPVVGAKVRVDSEVMGQKVRLARNIDGAMILLCGVPGCRHTSCGGKCVCNSYFSVDS